VVGLMVLLLDCDHASVLGEVGQRSTEV